MEAIGQLKAIVAVSRNGIIGQKNRIPWHISDELKFFKSITIGHIVLMGRRTFESIKLPLRDRQNWILTRSETFAKTVPAGVCIFHNQQEVLETVRKLPPNEEVWVIGGSEIYRQFLPYCSELILTEIKRNYAGDCAWCGHKNLFQPGELLCEHPDFTTHRWFRKS